MVIWMMLFPFALFAVAAPGSGGSSPSDRPATRPASQVSAAPAPAKAAPDATAAADDLRVMCFNVRFGTAQDGANAWPKRRKLVFDTIRQADPDLLGAQEVLKFQADELRDALPGYTFVGVGRDDGKEAGEFSPVFYRTDRFEQLAHGQFWLSTTPEKPGSRTWDSAIPRLVTWVRLRDRAHPEREFIFANTHWDHAGEVARLESAKLMRTRITEMRDGSEVILCGDLNCTEDDEPYAILVGRGDDVLQLTDTYRSAHPERLTDEATFHGFKGTESGSRIDFIFHTPGMHTIEAKIIRRQEGGRHPSDHYPITATIGWGPAEREQD